MITVSEHSNYSIITVTNHKFDSIIAGLIKTKCLHILSEKAHGLIIDLKHVKYLDSSGLSAILLAHRTSKSVSVPFFITHINSSPAHIIEIAQLTNILPIEDSLVNAIEKMKS